MMTTITFTLDSKDAKKFDKACKKRGVSTQDAFLKFVKKSIKRVTRNKKLEAFKQLERIRKSVNVNNDWKEELGKIRDERYENIG